MYKGQLYAIVDEKDRPVSFVRGTGWAQARMNTLWDERPARYGRVTVYKRSAPGLRWPITHIEPLEMQLKVPLEDEAEAIEHFTSWGFNVGTDAYYDDPSRFLTVIIRPKNPLMALFDLPPW